MGVKAEEGQGCVSERHCWSAGCSPTAAGTGVQERMPPALITYQSALGSHGIYSKGMLNMLFSWDIGGSIASHLPPLDTNPSFSF